MRVTLLLLSLLLIVGCAKAPPTTTPPPVNKDWKITGSWQYDFTNFFQCSAAVTKGCISGFTWGYLNGSTPVPLHTASVSACSTASPAVCSDVVNSQLPVGGFSFYITANYVDVNGVSGSTAQVPFAANIAALAPVGFSATWQ